jgi:hypothetical protein
MLTLGGVLMASQSVRPDYSATGHLQLIPPAHVPEQAAGAAAGGQVRNPWLDLGINALGQAAILKVTDERVVKELGAQGYSENIVITIDVNTTFFTVVVIGKTPEQATSTVKQVMSLLNGDVQNEQKQFGVADRESFTTLTLDQGDKVTVVSSKVKRVLIVAAGVGLLTTAGFTIGLDALLRRRARRRADALPRAAAASGEGKAGKAAPAVNGKAAAETTVLPVTARGRVEQPAPSRATKASARVLKSRAGKVFASKSAAPPELESVTTVVSSPRVGEPTEAGEKGRSPIVVEYQTHEHRSDDADKKPADAAKADAQPVADELPMPSDATIILPLNRDWAVQDSRGKGR